MMSLSMLTVLGFSQKFISYKTTVAEVINHKYIYKPSYVHNIEIIFGDHIMSINNANQSVYNFLGDPIVKKIDEGYSLVFEGFDNMGVKCKVELVRWNDTSIQIYVLYQKFQILYEILKTE